MTRSVFLTAAVLLVSSLSFAQEEPAPAEPPAPDPAVRFLAGLKGLNESICGTREWEIQYRGQHIGSAKLVVSPAPEGSGAVYEARFEAEMVLGAEAFSGSETSLHDEKLALISSDVWRSEKRGENTVEKTNNLHREDGVWIFTRTIGDKTTVLRQEFDGMVHGGTATELILVSTIVGSGAGTYTFENIDWPEDDAAEDAKPSVRELVVFVTPVPDALGPAEQIKSWKVEVTRVDKTVKTYEVALDGAIQRFGPDGSPVAFVSESYSPPPPARAASPTAAVVTYLRVLSGGVPLSALDGILDWVAVKEWISPGDETTLASFIAGVKERFSKSVGSITDAQVAAIAPMLGVSEKESEAVVHLPGQEANPFHLVKKDDAWYIVRFPR